MFVAGFSWRPVSSPCSFEIPEVLLIPRMITSNDIYLSHVNLEETAPRNVHVHVFGYQYKSEVPEG